MTEHRIEARQQAQYFRRLHLVTSATKYWVRLASAADLVRVCRRPERQTRRLVRDVTYVSLPIASKQECKHENNRNGKQGRRHKPVTESLIHNISP